MITKILHQPIAIAQHVVGGVARGGLHAAVAVARRILPATEPVRQPPSPTTTTKKAKTRKAPAKKPAAKKTPAKKAPAKKTSAKKSTTKKAAPKKPAAALDEDRSPVEEDPVVYSTGPDVATNVLKDDLDDLRP